MKLYLRSPFWLPGCVLILVGTEALPWLGLRTFQVPSLGSPAPLPFAVAIPLVCSVGILLCLVREGRAEREVRSARNMGCLEGAVVGAALVVCCLAWFLQSDLFPWGVAVRNLVGLTGLGLLGRRSAGEAASVSAPVVVAGLSLVAGRAFPDPVLTWITLPASSRPAWAVAVTLGVCGFALGLGQRALLRVARTQL